MLDQRQHSPLIVVTLVGTPCRPRSPQHLSMGVRHCSAPDRSAMMRIVPYAFRIRFVLAETVRLGLNHPEITMASSEADGEDVVLRCTDPDAEISKARTLLLIGQPYGSDEDARAAASRWSDWLQIAFADCNVGADFGDRAIGPGQWAPDARAEVDAANDIELLPDVHGIMTFALDPRKMFTSVSGQGTLGVPGDKVMQAIRSARAHSATMTSAERVAYDMYSASFSQPSADARFLLLMVAMEALIPRSQRDADTRSHIERMIEATQSSELPDQEIRALTGSLRSLRYRSIGQAGRALVRGLEPRQYMELTPVKFFTKCYDLRSALVHGTDPLPPRSAIDLHWANLTLLVSDLIGLRHGYPPPS
jgi:hypothetical protein